MSDLIQIVQLISGDTVTQLNYKSISHRVKRARDDYGWTQDDLARESGVSRATISRIEQGRGDEASIRFYEKLSASLNVKLDWLLALSDEVIDSSSLHVDDEVFATIYNNLSVRRRFEMSALALLFSELDKGEEWDLAMVQELVISSLKGTGGLPSALLRKMDDLERRIVDFERGTKSSIDAIEDSSKLE